MTPGKAPAEAPRDWQAMMRAALRSGIQPSELDDCRLFVLADLLGDGGGKPGGGDGAEAFRVFWRKWFIEQEGYHPDAAEVAVAAEWRRKQRREPAKPRAEVKLRA